MLPADAQVKRARFARDANTSGQNQPRRTRTPREERRWKTTRPSRALAKNDFPDNMDYMDKIKRSFNSEFSAADLNKRVGEVTHAAMRAPVAITRHGKPRFILLSFDEWERLLGELETAKGAGLPARRGEARSGPQGAGQKASGRLGAKPARKKITGPRVRQL